ncbi:putative membrane fusion protein [Geosporobacter subterraneus DSM 17957]|uniref:Putative membrane fusion protein n=1 Tax=Geosporobacter subterraneus DSM 17957 TaxID=1121919 RepID=A0A1M6GTV2_9FIRM|nr:HlyD family efflux transporter periplasmic adaptor subunit [Geosporobacter subterraneus]SHJ13319.1 putative membrane fusion protein [Geosporobacter subterraneus DSM 17957]
MSQKKSQKKGKVVFFRYFFFGTIVLYLLIRFAPMVMSSAAETEVVRYGSIQILHPMTCYIIRNEKLVKSNQEGEIKYFAQEGERVKKGYKIAEIYKDAVDDATRKKLEVINQRIENLNENKETLFERDIEKLDGEIHKTISQLKEYNEKGDLLKVEELKRELTNKLDKKRIIAGDKSFAGKNLEALKQEQQQLEKKINNSISWMISPEPGIVSYQIDGYESILNSSNMATLEYEKIRKIEPQITDLRVQKVIRGQPLFKIVDNNTWYMVTWLDKGLLDQYKVGRSVEFKFPQGQVKGQIFKIIENDNNVAILFKMDEHIDDFQKLRSVDLEAIVLNYEGLKVPKDSILEKDGKKGVLVLDINRYATFKPVKVKGYDETSAIVHSNIFYEKEGDQQKAVDTIKLYDEIVKNPSRVKEGQMIY